MDTPQAEPAVAHALAQIAATKEQVARLDAEREQSPARWGRPWGDGGHGNEATEPPRDFEPPQTPPEAPEPAGEGDTPDAATEAGSEQLSGSAPEVTPAVPGPDGSGDHAHAVLEPVTAGEVGAGEVIVWLGVRREVVDRRAMVGSQVRLWFGPQHYITVSARTPMQRVKR